MKTLLIANRGEIAVRVIRSARALGIRTVAIHTELDASVPHTLAADQAVEVSSYLDIDAVVAAAVASGADAIHPGYGFLSERATFARAVEVAGIKLVGPSSTVMDRMGRKDAAREIAVAAGVPVVPSWSRDAPAETLSYPVLVKAAAGGGGKGMRIVRAPGELDEALAAAAREAAHAFGDDTLLIEKYVESGRHVEVQVLADAHGHVVHLFERDCSTQRRHQKVLEEAPAPTITEQVRAAVTSAAVALTAQVGYENAGTVEFLLDNASNEAYFLEMNTRLQVEHPVTELAVAIRGEHPDLVALQLAVASGEPLGFTQDDVQLVGHAIEARVYAEDSFGGFLPQAGRASRVRWPGSDHARVDAALESGQVVSTAYDPMLGKVIASGPDRESARLALLDALDDTAILGLTTNVGFLRALVATDEFRDATIDTAWLDTATIEAPDDAIARISVAWVSAMLDAMGAPHPFGPDGWRSGADPAPYVVQLDEPVRVDRIRGRVDDHDVREVFAEDHVLVLMVDGLRQQSVVNLQPHLLEAVHRGQRFIFQRPDPFADAVGAVGDGSVRAPMPGTVLAVDVTVGDEVVEGQRLGVIEAMKMELVLKAPHAGTVAAVDAAVGDQVQLRQLLFLVEQSLIEQSAAEAGHG
ncbi:MAG: Carbamoyl-phosphate synthase chain, ATP-binding protein [Marmoricola sp.]|nr:Carbamoyl-phosphate synthase chain, ATP-binding protein [Marmoricola sp.]